MRALSAIALLALVSGCLPSPGPFVLRAAEGRVVDRDTGAAISDAWVIEWYRGAGTPGASQPEYHSRFVATGPDGRFAFDKRVAPSPRIWLLRTYGPSYSWYHPNYGLIHSGVPAEGESVELSGSRRDAELRHADLGIYCRGGLRGAGARRLAAIACPR